MTAASRISSDAIAPAIRYRDLATAVEWLCTAFGFELRSVARGQDGCLDYAELSFGSGTLLLGSARDEEADGLAAKSDQVGSSEIQSCYVLVDDIDALRVKAAQANVNIVFDNKADEFTGRSFSCRDLEGHIWFFGKSTPGSVQPRPQRGVAARPVANLAYGLLIFTIGFMGWLYVNSDSVDGRVTTPVNEPAKIMRAEFLNGALVQRHTLQEDNKLALLLKKEQEALEDRKATIRLAKKKLVVEMKKRHLAEQSARDAMTTIQRARAQRQELAEDVRKDAELAEQLKRRIDETNAQLTSKARHSPKVQVPQLIRPEDVVKNNERVIVERRVTSETAKLAARATQPTRQLLARQRGRRIAAQSSIINQAAAVAVRTESWTGNPPSPRPSPIDKNIGTGFVAPGKPAKLPTVITDLEIRSPRKEVDETAKETQLQRRVMGAAWPTVSRVSTGTPEKQEAPAPTAKSESSTAIKNARRLAEKLRKHQGKSQRNRNERALVDAERGGVTRNQEQPDLSDNGLTASKTTESDDILRRAFIAKW